MTAHSFQGAYEREHNQAAGPGGPPGEDDEGLALDDDDITEDVTEPGRVGDKVKAGFERDIGDARNLAKRFRAMSPEKKKQAQRQFVDEYGDNWNFTTNDNKTFLHTLIHCDSGQQGEESLEWLMTWGMSRFTSQMGMLDSTKQTPLTAAITSRNHRFVRAYIKRIPASLSTKIQEHLKITECSHNYESDTTCLHAAISTALPLQFTRPLIGLVPKEMFCVQDAKGRTPLHVAVEYERCNSEQVDIISELLAFGSNALEIRMEYKSLGRLFSAYQYHEYTRRKYRTSRSAQRTQSPVRPSEPAKSSEPAEKEKNKPSTEIDVNERAKRQEAELIKEKFADAKQLRELRGGVQRSRLQFGPRDGRSGSLVPGDAERTRRGSVLPQRRVQVEDGRTSPDPSAAETELQAQTNKGVSSPKPVPRRSTMEHRKLQADELEVNAKKIKSMLKSAYLRNTPPKVAFQCLHMQDPDQRDKELWFTFGLKPKTKITAAEFKNDFEHLEFEEMLQYVALPQVEFNQESDSPGSPYTGRTDMIFLFRWLRDKGVKRIVRVIVDDLGELFHSDEAIEEALKDLEVEVLDWRRLDMCPVTISKLSPRLREVTLQWSGKNATLRAWSAVDGLALTPSLEKIHLIQVKALDSQVRLHENLTAFEDRLKQSWPKGLKPPVVEPRKSSGDVLRPKDTSVPGAGGSKPSKSNADPHKWMQCMDEFAKWLKKIKVLNHKQDDPLLNPVTVALIDDGVEMTHEELRSHKLLGKSFDYSQDEWMVPPYWNSASGHGTLMARLIKRVCPSADIYVIKLKTFSHDPYAKLRIDTASAIQAIEHATELGAEVISMSWTVKEPEKTETSDEKGDFDRAIQAAARKDTLMFCSARDEGHSQPDFSYPHNSNPKLTFSVGAANDSAEIASFVGDKSKIDFAFPGQDITMSSNDPAGEAFRDFESHTGSSVATALASGLAALIFECVRLGVLYTNLAQPDPIYTITRDDVMKIRKREHMFNALRSISPSEQTNREYVEVRHTFKGAAQRLKNEQGNLLTQLEVVAGLAHHLLKKGVD